MSHKSNTLDFLHVEQSGLCPLTRHFQDHEHLSISKFAGASPPFHKPSTCLLAEADLRSSSALHSSTTCDPTSPNSTHPLDNFHFSTANMEGEGDKSSVSDAESVKRSSEDQEERPVKRFK